MYAHAGESRLLFACMKPQQQETKLWFTLEPHKRISVSGLQTDVRLMINILFFNFVRTVWSTIPSFSSHGQHFLTVNP